ncbi:leucine-rich repeat-containing protein 74B-like [Lineus longissimus]|uniref:leucine-rich repeat-containing protein 74B-like n=1 Tax=Lineus longissimus TaxID=88925 RepID=UPI00315D71D5
MTTGHVTLRRSRWNSLIPDYDKRVNLDSVEEYDTDLEVRSEEGRNIKADPAIGIYAYQKSCKRLGTPPQRKVQERLMAKEMDLKSRVLGTMATRAITTALTKNTRLEKVDLSDNSIGEEGALYVADMLCENDYITEIDLSHNQLGTRGAIALGQMMRENRSLQYLNLTASNFGEEDARYISIGIASNDSITHLNLSHNNFSEEGAQYIGKIIAQNICMTHLDLSWNKIRRKGAVTLCKGLELNCVLTSVDLSWNGFGYEGALAIGQLLKKNKTILELNLSNNRINWQGALFLMSGLKWNRTLEILRLGKNPLTTTGCMDLLEGLSHPESKVYYLDLTDVPVISAFEMMAEAIRISRPFDFKHGGVVMSHDTLGERHEKYKDPMQRVIEYMQANEIRPLEMFRAFDKSVNFKMGKKAFQERLKKTGLHFTHGDIDDLMRALKKAGGDDLGSTKGVTYAKLSRGVMNQKLVEREEKKRAIMEEEKLKRYHKNLLNPSLPPINVDETIETLETARSATPTSMGAVMVPGKGIQTPVNPPALAMAVPKARPKSSGMVSMSVPLGGGKKKKKKPGKRKSAKKKSCASKKK